jgi:serine/threonine protein phosphatase PrpC
MSEPGSPSRQAQTASLSDVGRVRSGNEDSCGEFTDSDGQLLLVVADGMGGHRGGAVASRMAVDTIGEVFQRGGANPRETLEAAFRTANERIFQESCRDPALAGMGTTGVALVLGPAGGAWVAHVGDSRAYRLRRGGFERLTDDHSWVLEEVRQGRLTLEEAAVHPRKSVLTRSIGVDRGIGVDIRETSFEPDDRFLICSDGLWGELSDEQMAAALAAEPPESAARTLVELANQGGGPDNITVQIAVAGTPAAKEEERPLSFVFFLAVAGALLAATLLWLAVSGP